MHGWLGCAGLKNDNQKERKALEMVKAKAIGKAEIDPKEGSMHIILVR